MRIVVARRFIFVLLIPLLRFTECFFGIHEHAAMSKRQSRSNLLIGKHSGKHLRTNLKVFVISSRELLRNIREFQIKFAHFSAELQNKFEEISLRFTPKQFGVLCSCFCIEPSVANNHRTIVRAVRITAHRLRGHTCDSQHFFIKGIHQNLLVGLFTGQGVQDGAVQGVVGIVSTVSDDMKVGFGTTFVDGLYSILYWLMIISMNLGIMNLLPLPALDGGRMLFLVIEGLRGKPFNREREGLVNLIGFALLIMLAIFITYKDIVALVH